MQAKIMKLLVLTSLLWLVLPAQAQQSEMFGPYELHYSVVNTTFIEPKVAATYGITRGEKRAILNLAVREHLPDGGDEARSMLLKGRTWDLIQDFKFINEEWRFFEVTFRPEGADRSYTFKLKHQLYIN
jgi:hypothetical protein